MIVKTHAICLRYFPFANTSRVVQWLTPESGRIATLVKGSQRARAGFLGQYDLFYTCELVYYVRMNSAVHIARECAPLNTRDYLRRDWKACAAASYFCDALSRVLPPQAAQANLFDFLDKALDTLGRVRVSPELIFVSELQLLHRLGLAPRLDHCARCGRSPAEDGEGLCFSVSQGGILCGACRRRDDPAGTVISTRAWAGLRRLQSTDWPIPEKAAPAPLAAVERNEIEDVLSSFMAYHLDVSLASRPVALDIVRRQLVS